MITNVTDISKYYLEEVLAKGKQFPKDIWNYNSKYDNAKVVTKTLIEKVLKWSDEDVKQKLSLNTFKQYSLTGMLNYLFNIDPHQPVEMHLKINSKDLTLIFNNNNLIIK